MAGLSTKLKEIVQHHSPLIKGAQTQVELEQCKEALKDDMLITLQGNNPGELTDAEKIARFDKLLEFALSATRVDVSNLCNVFVNVR